MAVAYEDALRVLRETLLGIPPTGADGFEGLAATALSAQTGLVLRLANSGLQFGRDASSPTGPFVIAMEAKRYTGMLRLEDIAGKVTVAAQSLDVDVWALCTTSAVSDLTYEHVHGILEDKGITLLCLDWTLTPIPPLAVVFAEPAMVTIEWFEVHRPTVDRTTLTNALTVIGARSDFASQAAKIRADLQAATAGIGALRLQASNWLRSRFTDQAASRETFGQIIHVADPIHSPVHRSAAIAGFTTALAHAHGRLSVVAVLGDEGMGKTWLVADWWVAQDASPILLMVSGDRIRKLVLGDPVGSLAQLLAEQDGKPYEHQINAWRRRLTRWSLQQPSDEIRFVLVLDGLNEHPWVRWADLISGLSRAMQALGGVLVITCRPEFWRREVKDRLVVGVEVTRVLLDGYSNSELEAALAPAGVSMTDLAREVRDFVKNPRVCAVAIHLIQDLSIQPDAWTIERLLLEYWRARLGERGDLLVHNISEFEKLLRSHAREWRDGPQKQFDRNKWTDHSGIAMLPGIERVASDLTEIEEGRFLQPSADQDGHYEFRPEVLPFALGLLTCDELLRTCSRVAVELDEALDRILAPVRGFDAIADVIAASVGIVCLSDRFPVELSHALVRAWFELQNKTEESCHSICAYMMQCPGPFLHVVENARLGSRILLGESSLHDLLVKHRDDPRLRPAVLDRIPSWFTRWSDRLRPLEDDAEASVTRQAAYKEKVSISLNALTPAEQNTFGDLTVNVQRPDSSGLIQLTAYILASRSLERFVPAMLGWSFARWVAPMFDNRNDDFVWVVRLNSYDPVQVRSAAAALASHYEPKASELGRSILATFLRLFGDIALAQHAETLSPYKAGSQWRRVEQFCNVDPYDPTTSQPNNLAEARRVANTIEPGNLWGSAGQTHAELDLESVTAALARFDPNSIVTAIRRIVGTIAKRTGIPLRQLAWRLPEIAPLLDTDGIGAVKSSLELLLDDHTRIDAADLVWIAAYLFATVAPSLSAEDQLKLFKRLPEGPLLLMALRDIKPVSASVFEENIRNAVAIADTGSTARTLVFATKYESSLAIDVRTVIIDSYFSVDNTLAVCAASAIERLDDPVLDDELLVRIGNNPPTRQHDREYAENALAEIIVRRNRPEFAAYLSARPLGWVARQLRGTTVEYFANLISDAVDVLGRPIEVVTPNGIDVVATVDGEGQHVTYSVRAIDEHDFDYSGEKLTRLMNAETYASDEMKAHKAGIELARLYWEALEAAGADALIAVPDTSSIELIAELYPERVVRWLGLILATTDYSVLRQLRNLGVALASAFAQHDAELSGQVFDYLVDVDAVMNIILSGEKIPLWEYAVFSAPSIAPLLALRERAFMSAFSDAQIEDAVIAAEERAEPAWIETFVEGLMASGRADLQARGLTIAGLRFPNPSSAQLLSRDWGTGFLGIVAQAAVKNYQRAVWAEDWLRAAAGATNPIDSWRFATLAKGIADRRILRVFRELHSSVFMQTYGDAVLDGLTGAHQSRTKKRVSTLFGAKAPSRELVALLVQ